MSKLDIKALTKEQKIQALEALREKKRRAKMLKPPFTPNEGQLKVIQSKALEKWVFAGNGGGKTALLVNWVWWNANGYCPITKEYYPVPNKTIVLLDLPSKVTEKWIPEIRKWFDLPEDWLRKNGKPYPNEIALPNGSQIIFMFWEQPLMAFESIEVENLAMDEPPPRPLYVALSRGGRNANRTFKTLMGGTPISAAWMRMEIYEPWKKGEMPLTECFIYGTEVNRQNLAEGYIERFAAKLSDKEKEIRLNGMFYDLDGLALAHLFKKQVHVVPRPIFERTFDPTANPVIVAIDPHPSKAHVAVMVGADRDNNLFYIKELSQKLVARQFAKELIKWMQGYRITDIVCDSLGNSDGTGGEGFKSFIEVVNEVLREHRLRARATTYAEKSDEDFIEKIREVLLIPDKPNNFGMYLPKLRIVEGNLGITKDIENVGWLRHKDIDQAKDKLDIRVHDFLACLKYALAANPHYKKGKTEVYRPSAPVYGMSHAGVKPSQINMIRSLKQSIKSGWDWDDE